MDTKAHIAGLRPMQIEVEAGKKYYWCACGLSQNQPFCDGSHQGGPFAPVPYEAEETGAVKFCACKHTKGQPLCDGTHKTLEPEQS